MAFFIEGQVIVQLTDFIGQRSFPRSLLVEAEAIRVEAEAVDEIAASTSLPETQENCWQYLCKRMMLHSNQLKHSRTGKRINKRNTRKQERNYKHASTQ